MFLLNPFQFKSSLSFSSFKSMSKKLLLFLVFQVEIFVSIFHFLKNMFFRNSRYTLKKDFVFMLRLLKNEIFFCQWCPQGNPDSDSVHMTQFHRVVFELSSLTLTLQETHVHVSNINKIFLKLFFKVIKNNSIGTIWFIFLLKLKLN